MHERGWRKVLLQFGYQGKCLQWLREAYAALSDADRGSVDAVLDGTGCERLFV